MRRRLAYRVALAAASLLFACDVPPAPELKQERPPRPLRDDGTGASVGGATGREQVAEARPPRQAAVAGSPRPLVVFLGDSLTAGYGLAAEEAYPTLVGRLLAERGLPVRAVNAGVSGDTTAGGLARLDWLLRQEPDVVVVALGANDGLRALPVSATEANLRAILERAEASGARVLLAGMRMPPNYGSDYVREFEAIYPRLAAEFDVPLLPFLLAGVAAEPLLNLPDGIHPNVEGQSIVARTVAEALAPVVAGVGEPSDGGGAF